MGAWSEDSFGNDTACDWVGDFLEEPGLQAVSKALDVVMNEEGDLDSDLASEALAACEVIARLKGNWGLRNGYNKELDQWIIDNPQEVPANLVQKGESVIKRILGEDSELADLWDESDWSEDWRNTVDDLEKRIKS